MQVLGQRSLLESVRRVEGTSAGAINALIYALGYTIPEQREILGAAEFANFMDDSFGYRAD